MKQEEFFGEGSIENLEIILSKMNSKNIFLVTGKNSFKSSGAEKKLKRLLKNYNVTHFSEFTDNPKIDDVKKGIELLGESKCDIVIAVGGGSVIDMAKSVNILSEQSQKPEEIIEGKEKITNKGKPLIAIPTTSGAGSESTHFAVVYINKNKFSLAHEYILPDKIIIDPQLTYNLNPEITATSGIDALSQAMESYWSVNSNGESKKYSGESIKLIYDNLETAVNNPTTNSRVSMSRAANLAGKAINITKTTAPHAVSYSMTSYFNVPHGQAVSITLGEFMEYNYGVSEKDISGTKSVFEIKQSIEELISLTGCKDIDEAKEKLKQLMKRINLKTRLSELNIKTKKDLDLILSNVNTERLQNNPRAITRNGLENILRNIL